MRKCNKCLEEKELNSFDENTKGSGVYRKTCRRCRNDKTRKSYLSKEGNVEKIREYQRLYQKKHRENNPYYKLYCQCLWDIRSKVNSPKPNDLKLYLENLFTSDMSWDNYGSYWEVDHIDSAIRMAKCGYTIYEINKLTNLRPLIVIENRQRSKRDAYDEVNKNDF